MKLTTDHSASSHGVPIFVDENNNPIDYSQGFRLLRRDRGWSTVELGDKLGVSGRTIEGYEQGRMPTKTVLLLLARLI